MSEGSVRELLNDHCKGPGSHPEIDRLVCEEALSRCGNILENARHYMMSNLKERRHHFKSERNINPMTHLQGLYTDEARIFCINLQLADVQMNGQHQVNK